MLLRGISVAARYRAMRRVLVWLRRAAIRWHINFDNAVESSAKDVRGITHSNTPMRPGPDPLTRTRSR